MAQTGKSPRLKVTELSKQLGTPQATELSKQLGTPQAEAHHRLPALASAPSPVNTVGGLTNEYTQSEQNKKVVCAADSGQAPDRKLPVTPAAGEPLADKLAAALQAIMASGKVSVEDNGVQAALGSQDTFAALPQHCYDLTGLPNRHNQISTKHGPIEDFERDLEQEDENSLKELQADDAEIDGLLKGRDHGVRQDESRQDQAGAQRLCILQHEDIKGSHIGGH
eukprot:g31267.t1